MASRIFDYALHPRLPLAARKALLGQTRVRWSTHNHYVVHEKLKAVAGMGGEIGIERTGTVEPVLEINHARVIFEKITRNSRASAILA